jgi:Uma2 family endonuclease
MALPRKREDRPWATVGEYLAFERASMERHIFLDGAIIAMAGESPAHGDISANLLATVVNQLKGGPCRARSKDTKVRSGPVLTAGETSRCLFSYPDVVVICNDPEYLDERQDVILNPMVIMEVLSPSTEAFDRGVKFTRFQTWNASLTHYVLVSQDQPQIEHFSRQPDGTWLYRLTIGLGASVTIDSIRCTLRPADVYDRVEFPKHTHHEPKLVGDEPISPHS